ncbi:MAG: hypothetical protein GXP23_04180 [Gammaproteobacteria bacterium]|nr:hypothetical protein [Gammaproteobacteria bacterium]
MPTKQVLPHLAAITKPAGRGNNQRSDITVIVLDGIAAAHKGNVKLAVSHRAVDGHIDVPVCIQ